MSDSSRTRNMLLLLFVPIVFGLAFLLGKTTEQQTINTDLLADDKTPKNSAETLNSGNTAKLIISAPSPPVVRQRGTAKGLNSAIKFEKDFETSLKIQEVPDVWFEYIIEDKQAVKVEIPTKAKEFIKKRWLNKLQFSYQNQAAGDRAKFNVNQSYNNDAAVYASKIDDLQVTIALEKRNISMEEAFDVMSLTAKLAIERYEELQKMSLSINSPKISE